MTFSADGSLPARAECVRQASAMFHAARDERDELYASAGGGRAGAEAVGRAAWPGDPVKAAEAAELYLAWLEEDRARRDRGAA